MGTCSPVMAKGTWRVAEGWVPPLLSCLLGCSSEKNKLSLKAPDFMVGMCSPTLLFGHEGGLRVKLLLLHIEWNLLRVSEHLVRIPPEHLPLEVYQALPSGQRPGWSVNGCGFLRS